MTSSVAVSSSAPCRRRVTCRACDGRRLELFLSLGPTPLANSFLDSPDQFEDELSFPLDVYFCLDCSLVQLLDVVSPELLFRNYIYVTGTSDTIAEHNRQYAGDVLGLGPTAGSDLVVEIASNDGSLLENFRARGVRTLGVEPAANIAAQANARGIETLSEFFDGALGRALRPIHGPARAVIANNVLAHVDDPRDFLAGAAALIDDGYVVVEVPYLGELVRRSEYDTIYHEHLCYFSVTALSRLFASAGLSIARVQPVAVHGGSMRFYGQRREIRSSDAPEVDAFRQQERAGGLARLDCLQEFAAGVRAQRDRLRSLLADLQTRGKTVAGYGAPAKGNTLLNFCGIDSSLVPWTADKNAWKVGKFTPGMHIPVLPVSALLERQPDYVLILAWNFAGEIMRQQDEYRRRGGRFIVPIPQPEIV